MPERVRTYEYDAGGPVGIASGIAGAAFAPAEDALLGYIISLTSLAVETAIDALKKKLSI